MSHEAIKSVLKETRRFEPSEAFASRARVPSREAYDRLYRESLFDEHKLRAELDRQVAHALCKAPR
jgi:hypothetical protein